MRMRASSAVVVTMSRLGMMLCLHLTRNRVWDVPGTHQAHISCTRRWGKKAKKKFGAWFNHLIEPATYVFYHESA